MNSKFIPVSIEDIRINPFTKIGQDWMLITAGNISDWNTMTASWGGLGVIWHRNVSYVFVRFSRYTYEFMEKYDRYTLSFFPEQYKKALSFAGSHSGRDVNKAEKTGLIPFAPSKDSVSFEQAEMIIICRKIFAGNISQEDFLDPSINDNYKTGDYHKMYIGQIEGILKNTG